MIIDTRSTIDCRLHIILEDYKPMKVLAHTKIAGIKSLPIVIDSLTGDNLDNFKLLVGKMIRTCVEESGLGLAAPQVGINKTFFISIDPTSLRKESTTSPFDSSTSNQQDQSFRSTVNYNTYLNPTWVAITEDGKETEKEGCLSVKTEQPLAISRYRSILASWHELDLHTNEIKEMRAIRLTGMRARLFMHECEHLSGGNIVETYKRQNNNNNRGDNKKKR